MSLSICSQFCPLVALPNILASVVSLNSDHEKLYEFITLQLLGMNLLMFQLSVLPSLE